jgi:hypothetical protein
MRGVGNVTDTGEGVRVLEVGGLWGGINEEEKGRRKDYDIRCQGNETVLHNVTDLGLHGQMTGPKSTHIYCVGTSCTEAYVHSVFIEVFQNQLFCLELGNHMFGIKRRAP